MDMATHVWWPYMHRDIIKKTAKCNTCVKIGKNLKSIISSSKWAPLKLCKEPYEETQFDIGGPIYNEKNQEVYFLACRDRFLKFPTAEVIDRANADNILKFLQGYVLLPGIPHTINFSQFEAHFSRKTNTPLSNISTEPEPSTLTHKPIFKKLLDMETVRWDELISDEQWDTEARSDIQLEISRDRLSKDAVRQCNAALDKESRVIPHTDVGQAVPRTESSLTFQLAKKNPKAKDLRKLWTVLTRFWRTGHRW